MDQTSINPLLSDLRNSSEQVRNRATQELWRIWFQQKGVYGTEILRRSQLLLGAGEIAQATAVLTELIKDQPDFAEAWNRRAVLYYAQGQYSKSLEDCRETLKLNPVQFGALHGLGLCHAALGEYSAAIQAFRQALAIQPYTLIHQKLIFECTVRLG